MKFLISLLLISSIEIKVTPAQKLSETIKETNVFFNDLKKKYELKELTPEIKSEIDKEIDMYMEETLKKIGISRNKKHAHGLNEKGSDVRVFHGLEEISHFNLPKLEELYFFDKYIGHEQLFGVTLISTNLTVYRVIENQLIFASSYHVGDAKRIYVLEINNNIIFVVQKLKDISIFTFLLQNKGFVIKETQKIVVTTSQNLSFRRGSSQLLMGLSLPDRIYIYYWSDDNFKLMQTLPFRCELSIFFGIDDAVFMVTTGYRRTTILKYRSQTRLFESTQLIKRASFSAIAVMQMKSHFTTESFLALSNKNKTILYKWSRNIFLPFQQISPADEIMSVTENDSAIFFLLKDNTLIAYEHNGWKFLRGNLKLQGVDSFSSLTLKGKKFLLIRSINGDWSLNRIKWKNVENPAASLKELGDWCQRAKKRVESISKTSPDMKESIRVLKSQMQKVKVKSINGFGIVQLQNYTNHHDRIVTRITALNQTINQAVTTENATFNNLRANIVRIKCTNDCKTKNLVTEIDCDFANMKRISDKDQTLKFEHVKVNQLKGFPCPAAGVKLEKLIVKGLLNGYSFDDLQKNVLKTTGDQEVFVKHIFEELHVNSLEAPNIEPASTHARLKVETKAVYAKELNLTDGGLLLPLDGEPVTMTGTLTAKVVKLIGPTQLRGGLRGNGIKRYAPMVDFENHHELRGNYTLSNVKILKSLTTEDIARKRGKSFKEIAEKAVPLDGDMPVHLTLQKNLTLWENITVENLPNWLTKKNSEMVKVTGTKISIKTVTMPNSLYSNLPIPKIKARACSIGAISPDIKTSTLRVGRATAKFVNTDKVYGAKALNNIISDSITSLDEADLSKKNFTANVHIKKLNLSNIQSSPFRCFESMKSKWYKPDVIGKSIKVNELKTNSLLTTKGVKIPSPTEIQNLIVEGNLRVKRINGVDLKDFMKNVVRINETISLQKVTFEGSVAINELHTKTTNIDLQSLGKDIDLGSKTIIGDLVIDNDFSANVFSYPSFDDVSSYVINGSVRFKREPHVERINGIDLQQIIPRIWMLDQPVNLPGNFMLKNITLHESFDLFEKLNTPELGSWRTLATRILSKTKLQEINVPVTFRLAEIPNIVTREKSILYSSDPYINDLLYMTLKKNGSQIIRDKWWFNELTITENVTLLGKINGLNLSTDVARHGVEKNIVTGEKILNDLKVDNLVGLNFGEWAKDAFLISDMEKPIIITGKKTFKNLKARKVIVDGTLMGKRLENCLMRSGDQIITASKTIKGSLHASPLTVNGLLNGVNFTEFINNNLEKYKPNQIIESDVVLKGHVRILGNLTIRELKNDVDLLHKDEIDKIYAPSTTALAYLKPFVSGIKATVKHRAKYWDKFQDVKKKILVPADSRVPVKRSLLKFHGLGDCMLISMANVKCSGQDSFSIRTFANSSTILLNQMLSVDSVPIVVQVNSGPRSRIAIYQYDYITNSFELHENVRVPGITQASVTSLNGILWIAARLKSAMLVLRYEPWGDMRKYYLSDSRHFVLDRVPSTNELILVREDGMWKLDGLAGPRHAFKVTLAADEIETFSVGNDFFVKLICKNSGTRLLKARYVGI